MKTEMQYTETRLELLKGEYEETWFERNTGWLMVAFVIVLGLVGGIAG